jgi:hypothetical protein
MEPVFVQGELKGFAVIDAETGEVLEMVAKENVTTKPKEIPPGKSGDRLPPGL